MSPGRETIAVSLSLNIYLHKHRLYVSSLRWWKHAETPGKMEKWESPAPSVLYALYSTLTATLQSRYHSHFQDCIWENQGWEGQIQGSHCGHLALRPVLSTAKPLLSPPLKETSWCLMWVYFLAYIFCFHYFHVRSLRTEACLVSPAVPDKAGTLQLLQALIILSEWRKLSNVCMMKSWHYTT